VAEYTVTFERIGRNRSASPLTVTTTTEQPAQEIAEAVWSYARRWLLSSELEVNVDLERGTVALEFGRFGRGTVTEAVPDVA
jgi:hypothetical protein